MINFTNTKDEELFDEPFLSEYRNDIQFFYSELVYLNVQLFMVDRIRRFRFDLFVRPSQTTFFSTVLNSFFESSILRVARLVTDNDGDFRTIIRFKNKIYQNMQEMYKKDFQERLRECKFDKNTDELLERIRTRRNQRIAHIIRNVNEEELRKSTIYLKELFSLRDKLNLLLTALSFGTTRMMLPLEYDDSVQHPAGVDSRADIERMLDHIAFDSSVISLPEKNPVFWEARKRSLKEHDIEEINIYRSKLGLENA